MKIIDDYVNGWKIKQLDYYKGVYEKMKAIDKSNEPLTHDEIVFLRLRGFRIDKNTLPSYYKGVAYSFMEFGNDRALAGFVKSGKWDDVERLIGERMEKRKEDMLKKMERKVGYFEENNLRMINGEIRGTIKGKKKYRVQTKTTGGHNIMTKHFRLYFSEVKEKKV